MLENISIPNSVTSVGIGILDGTEYYNNDDNRENGLLYCGAYLLEADYTITDCVVKSGTKLIADSAFWYHDYLESITLPDTLQAIGDMSFISCTALKSVKIPDSVKTIGNVAFYGCTSLDEITIGNGITNIGDSVFDITAYYSDINNWDNGALYIDGCLVSGELSALDESGWQYVTVTEVKGDYTVKTGTRLICDNVFNNRDKLTSVTVPDSVKYIGERALGYHNTEMGYEIKPDFRIVCYAVTAAEQYAIDNGIDYTLLERPNGEYGDVNDDGKINLLDLIAMRKHLAKWNVEIDKAAADCNADGKVNLLDLVLLRKYLAKWNVVLGLQG
ncbi:MAG: leucine-rich repeat protein, partial [Acutalibacteraceae bacterium]